MKQLIKTVAVALLFGTVFMPVLAEDTELFVTDFANREGYRPKVLVIFDTSGSMRASMTLQEDYEPSTIYPELDGEAGRFNDMMFYRIGEHRKYTKPPKPGQVDEKRYFHKGTNACAESILPMVKHGLFVGRFRRFETSGRNAGKWRNLPWKDGRNVGVIDCLEDMNERNVQNPYGVDDYAGVDTDGNAIINSSREGSASSPFNAGEGYPFDSRRATGPLYTDTYNSRNRKFSKTVTIYDINYLRWYYGVGTPVTTTRLAVAKNAVSNLVESVPGVDFGLMIFNRSGSGGRIIRGIEKSSPASHKEIIDVVNTLNADGNTPLCETLYEAKRFFTGESVFYGTKDGTRTPLMDGSIASSGVYISPFEECADIAYVILVTDGEPTSDTGADSSVAALPGVTASQKVAHGNHGASSYLAALANYMHKNDIFTQEPNLADYKAANQDREPKQTVTTYTIGFGEAATSDAAELLKETALRGGGEYFEAVGSVGLESALYDALVDILLTDSSMTSPAIAANNFDRTRSLDNIYYSMFMPGSGPRWAGNIKKLKMDASGILKDKNGDPAIDAFGNIKSDAASFWALNNDAEFIDDISKNGVNASLTMGVSSRRILTEQTGSLISLDSITPSADSASLFGVLENEVTPLITWIYGTDLDDDDGDGDRNDARKDLFADPFHSKPLVLNLSTDPLVSDLRLVVGTNSGMLHFFKDNGGSVSESWAFLPSEFISHQNLLKINTETSTKLYGVDGSPITYQHGEKTYLYFGLRRGGNSYYALDISSPDSPAFMWKIDASTIGFEELGQSWSRPVITYIPGYVDSDNKQKPVILISGGYDTNKDTDAVGTPDSAGRGLFMLDAVTGALIWSVTPRAATSTNKQFVAFTDSMPSAPAVLDSNGDGITDRVYLSDTGGNVWRLDLATTDKSQWSIFKFAELGGDLVDNDLRFFYTPSITRTLEKSVKQELVSGEMTNSYSMTPYDAILLGSGDRTRLASSQLAHDYFFMLKDEHIAVTNFGSGIGEVPYPAPIKIDSLAEIADDPIGSATSDAEVLAAQINISSAKGWHYLLPNGFEKSVGEVIVLQGSVYFTTFTPPGTGGGLCVQMGVGRVYSVNLHSGENTHNWRSMDIGERVPDTLVVHSGVNEKGESTLRILGAGQGDEVGFDLNKDGEIGETEKVNSGNILSNASMIPKKVHTHEQTSY